MQEVTFVTGNQKKADYLAEYFGFPVAHEKIDLDELQSLNLKEVVSHKVHQAYEKIQKPVLVEDASLEFVAFGRLPGTYIKSFIGELSIPGLCRLLDGKERSAIARCGLSYFDGREEVYFEKALVGNIAENPRGTGGFGWDPIFIPEGSSFTLAEQSKEEYHETYLQIKPLEEVRDFILK